MFLYLKLHIDFLATRMADKHLKEAGAHPALTYYCLIMLYLMYYLTFAYSLMLLPSVESTK